MIVSDSLAINFLAWVLVQLVAPRVKGFEAALLVEAMSI
jgi:hypothetical protein